MGTEHHFGKDFIRCNECSNLIDFDFCEPVDPTTGKLYRDEIKELELENMRLRVSLGENCCTCVLGEEIEHGCLYGENGDASPFYRCSHYKSK